LCEPICICSQKDVDYVAYFTIMIWPRTHCTRYGYHLFCNLPFMSSDPKDMQHPEIESVSPICFAGSVRPSSDVWQASYRNPLLTYSCKRLGVAMLPLMPLCSLTTAHQTSSRSMILQALPKIQDFTLASQFSFLN
jgi:hypothetical protein